MEECVAKGLTKSIGISNFTIKKTENLLKTAKIPPAVSQGICAGTKELTHAVVITISGESSLPSTD